MIEQLLAYARGLNANAKVTGWIEQRLARTIAKGKQPSTEDAEHIIDFFISGDAPQRFENMSYDEAHAAAEKWTQTLAKQGAHIHETPADTEIVLDFKDGFKVVKLIGEPAYEREGYLMRHCVASYFGNGKEVFSLRDAKNMPHCTIEKDQQIKGKGNGDIHPKYIDYIVRFLEHTGMDVRDSEMSHLGYEPVPFGKYATTKLYRHRYAVKGTQVTYKDTVRFFDTASDLKTYQGKTIALFRGDLIIESKTKLVVKSLTEVSGSVYVIKGATLTAPKLTKSGSVYVSKGATLTAPKLTEVNGSVDMSEGATLTAPKLTEVSGYVYMSEGATLTAPKLTKSGSVYVSKGATLTAPKLTEVSGYVDVREGATLIAPLIGYPEKKV